jgi:transcriptional regulator with XRE-family HTH domain
MAGEGTIAAQTPWLALRTISGLSQREVERRLGWQKRGHLSLIERGVRPTAEQEAQLREFYGRLLQEGAA